MNDWSDIGEQLQKEREKRDLSLQDVAHEIRIPTGTLRALEENDYSTFSSPAYTKSFLQQYSDYLQIDAHDLLDNFQTGNVLVQSDRIEYLDQKKSSSSHRSAPVRRNASQPVETSVSLAQPLLILLITGGLIAGGIWGFFAVEKRLDSNPEPVTRKPPEEEKEKPTEPSPTVKNPPEARPLPVDDARPPKEISGGNTRTIASTDTNNGQNEPAPTIFVFPEDKPPPRAVIVEEDEE